MTELALASFVFVILHVMPITGLREKIIDRIGDPAYMGLFSFVSVLGLAWMIVAYGNAPAGEPAWTTGPVVRWLTALLMLFPFILLVAGGTAANPTGIFGDQALRKGGKWGGIYAITRHPVMWAIALWAILHLVNRPEPRALLFFGALAVLALAGAYAQDSRKNRKLGKAWTNYARQTSHVPFAALLSGRTTLKLKDINFWRVGIAIAVWLVVLYYHSTLFGVAPVPL